MSLEIERRFLVKNLHWLTDQYTSKHLTQGYISISKERTVRVRVVENQAILNIKVAINDFKRHEFEYPIPLNDAQEILKYACPWILEKQRYLVYHGAFCFEVDILLGENQGLILAEIELPDEHAQFNQPDWLGEEVTHDNRYTAAYLSQHPFNTWNAL